MSKESKASWLSGIGDSSGGVMLHPHGWVATANLRDFEELAGNERLQRQAEAENRIFDELGFRNLLDEGRASHSALITQLNKAFISHLKTTWVPETLKKLDAKKGEFDDKNKKMGWPPAHRSPTPPKVKSAIVEVLLACGVCFATCRQIRLDEAST